MARMVRAWGLLALGSLTLAVSPRAEDASFDGAPGAPIAVPSVDKKALKAAAAQTQAAPRPKRSAADLYYFTREEAAEAARRFPAHRPHLEGWTFDPDVPANIQTQMKADLAFIAGLKGDGATPLHQQIFGVVDGQTYARFFDSRVTGIGLNDCGNPNAVACVIPFMDPSKMWITQNYIKFSHPQVARMMVVYHEARHTETQNGNWPHATCPDPFRDANGNDMRSIWTGAALAGEPACDQTPFGSYGSSTIMLKNIQKHCANCTDKVRMDAGLYADDQLGRITDADAKTQMQDDFNR